jgi:tetratricopeptide (TPR) repeat protein
MEKGASEIVKLTERIAKDPKSKLFVPLAEEYKKVGDIEMAIAVLQEGLKNNPTYVTARSFLGRLLMENGDLPGAQKELEEVIKAIPDNLLAQRKLADLFILTGRNADALERYKTVLALNPGDKEVKALLADLEAGKDISSRIPKPKMPSPPAAATEPKAAAVPPKTAAPSPAAAAAAPQPPKPAQAPAAVRPAPAAAPPKPAAPVPPSPATTRAAAAKQAATAPAPPKAAAGQAPAEVPDLVVEEIVELEHLEQPEAAAAPVVQAEEAASAAQAPAAMEPAFDLAEGATFDLSEGAGESAPLAGGPEAVQWEPPAVDEVPLAAGEIAAVSWEPPAAEEAPLAVEPEAESWEPPAAPAAAAPAAAAGTDDDINTNTLAELYITQGFYEKAIEIYEGMLAENPGSVALQQKLAKIRSMAGVAEQNAAFTAPVAEPSAEGEKVDVFAAGPDARSAQAPAAERTPAPETRPPAPPVTAEPTLPRTAPRVAATPAAGPQAASVRRKETIDRLESWLKNIIKEKP